MPRTVHDPHSPPTRNDAAGAPETGGDAHVSGIVVHAVADHADEVAGWIDTLDGAEVAAREGGRLVVVLEAGDEHALADMVNRISLAEHVYSAALVSHYVDDPALAEDAAETTEPEDTDTPG
jgi:nitrate reductase NapAB chaperone NapD